MVPKCGEDVGEDFWRNGAAPRTLTDLSKVGQRVAGGERLRPLSGGLDPLGGLSLLDEGALLEERWNDVVPLDES